MSQTESQEDESTANEDIPDEHDVSRRMVLAGAAGLAAAGASGYLVGNTTAQTADPVGEVGTSSNPYLIAFVDRMHFVARSSDPSSPADGTIWYNPGA